MNRFKHVLYVTTAISLASAAMSCAQSQQAATPAAQPNLANEWPTYGHDKGGMRFSPLTQITSANVSNLGIAWTYHMMPSDYTPPPGRGGRGGGGDDEGATPAARFQASEVTPLIIDGLMYITTPYGHVVALDSSTGKEVWNYKLPNGNPSTRGVEYYPGDEQSPPLIIVGTSDSKLFTLDPKTGTLNTRFGDNGFLTLEKSTTSPPVTYKNLIIVGGRVGEGGGPGTPGDVHAYDIHTGQMVWTFHTVPQPGEPNFGSWEGDSWKQRSGVNVWGFMTVDAERGIVYLPLGAPSSDMFGGDRPGNNLYGSSLVALDAATGKYLWHFQVVHHDIFDFDLEAPPLLMDVKQGNQTIPAVAIISKVSILFILDRVTGKPIYDVEERPVPASELPGEKASPTQPFPVKPPPLARQSMTMDEIAKVTPELEAACRKMFTDQGLVLGPGPYTPISYGHSRVNFPSSIGGSNWGGGSFNPDLGYFFVNVSDMGQMTGNRDPDSGPVDVSGLAGTNPRGGRTGPYSGTQPSGRFRDNDTGMLCNEPPWGELVAVNVNTGDIAWKVPLGITESLPADKQKTGRPNLGGSIATAGGLVFVGATDDSYFRAFDARTGEEKWSMKLSGSGYSVPASYLGKDGKQYIVTSNTGGGNTGAPLTSDEITAFTLK